MLTPGQSDRDRVFCASVAHERQPLFPPESTVDFSDLEQAPAIASQR